MVFGYWGHALYRDNQFLEQVAAGQNIEHLLRLPGGSFGTKLASGKFCVMMCTVPMSFGVEKVH